MKSVIAFVVTLIVCAPTFAQKKTRPRTSPTSTITIQTAVTKEGRTVLLKSDGSWEYTSDPTIDQKKPGVANEAIKALRAVAVATEVGINVEEYRNRVIDTKSLVDQLLKELDEGQPKDQIQKSLNAYVDASQAWNQMISKKLASTSRSRSEPVMFPDADEFAGRLQREYNIPTETFDPGANATDYMKRTMSDELKPFRIMRQNAILQAIWKKGFEFLREAESLTSAK